MQNWGKVDPGSGVSGLAASCSPERGVAVRDSNSVTRPAARAAIVGVLATFVSFALLPCGVAAASITLFEGPLFHPGSVNGQSGVGGFPWKSSPPGTINCVDWPVATPQQLTQDSTTRRSSPTLSLLLASLLGSAVNRCVCRTHVRLVSSSTRRIPHRELQQVGEERLNKVFIAEFAFMSKTPAYQPGLFLSVSPDSGEGSRMSWVGLEDTPDWYPGQCRRYP